MQVGKDIMLQRVQEFSHFRLTKLKDLIYLAPRLRFADKQEIVANSGSTPIEALYKGYKSSDILFTIINPKGEPVGLFGVNNAGAIWLLATDNLKDIKIAFLKECKKVINLLNKKYKVLWNFVDCRNELHIKWLKWCGFTFIKKLNYGVLDKPFYEFVRINYV